MTKLFCRKSLLAGLFFTGLVSFLFIPKANALEVVEIINGDNYLLDSGEEVKLAGVNANILKKRSAKSSELAREAVNYLASLLSTSDIRVEDAEVSKDKDGLRYVYLYAVETEKTKNEEALETTSVKKEILVNTEIIRRGYARPVRSYEGKYRGVFQAADSEAKHKRIGYWRS